MAKAGKGSWQEAALAVAMLLSFFTPWLYSMGNRLAAYQIREHLAGPHRLISRFTQGSRISQDYRLSLFLYAIPICAGLILAMLALGKYRAWMGLPAAIMTVAAFVFLRGEAAAMPFQELAWGPYLALASGVGLALIAPLRWLAGAAKRP
jgi:hypothetical protein